MIRAVSAFLLVALVLGLGVFATRSAAVTVEPRPEWRVAGELSRPRAYARAVVVATGEILILGGMDATDERVSVPYTELFDPASGIVTVLDQPIAGRLNQGVTVAWGDRVVVTGGTEWLAEAWRSVSRTDVYLPWSRTWLRAPHMRQPRSDHGAVALQDGRVLVTAGNKDARVLRSSEIFDPRTMEWSDAAPLPRGRTQFSMATLPDGRVLVAGGFEEDGRITRGTWLYTPWTDSWTRGAEMLEVRLNHSMVRLPDGDLLFFGGEAMGAGTAERYNWRAGVFEYAGVLGEPRLIAQGALAPEAAASAGAVIAVGGLPQDRSRKSFAPTADAEIWDPVKRAWLDLVDPPTSRAYAQLVVTDRAVFRLSGIGLDEVPIQTIEVLTWR